MQQDFTIKSLFFLTSILVTYYQVSQKISESNFHQQK